MLVQSPADFTTTVLVVERLGGTMGEAPRGAAAGHQGPTPMELGQAQGQGQATYTSCGGFAGRHGGHGDAGGGSGPRTCHYCHQPGHFMLSCPKLKRDMAARKAGRCRANQAASTQPGDNHVKPAGASELGNHAEQRVQPGTTEMTTHGTHVPGLDRHQQRSR